MPSWIVWQWIQMGSLCLGQTTEQCTSGIGKLVSFISTTQSFLNCCNFFSTSWQGTTSRGRRHQFNLVHLTQRLESLRWPLISQGQDSSLARLTRQSKWDDFYDTCSTSMLQSPYASKSSDWHHIRLFQVYKEDNSATEETHPINWKPDILKRRRYWFSFITFLLTPFSDDTS